MIVDNKIKILSSIERNELLQNAYSSFTHGVHHFSEFENDDNNVKFAIVHIFNTIELLVKAYLGSENLHLLLRNIEDSYSSTKPTADISTLLRRMQIFSNANFDDDLQKKITELRINRNDIEHKKFVLESEEKTLLLLCEVINGLIVFSYNHVGLDICADLIAGTKKKFDNTRMKIDTKFVSDIERVDEYKKKSYTIGVCPYCLNTAVPYQNESVAKCFICDSDVSVHKCHECSKVFIYRGNGVPMFCDLCKEGFSGDYILRVHESEPPDPWEEFDNLPRENY